MSGTLSHRLVVGRHVYGCQPQKEDTFDAAVAVAARIPPARMGGAVEVWPSARYW
jgi:hypothetical protein